MDIFNLFIFIIDRHLFSDFGFYKEAVVNICA